MTMALYLSSFRMGDRFDELLAGLEPGAKVAVISNAVDFIPTEERADYLRTVFDPVREFVTHGLNAIDIDLRGFFGKAKELDEMLADVRLVWAVGGNVFLLRRAMRASGLDDILKRRLARRSLIYGGWSAGAVVAGPTLRGIEIMDNPDVVIATYGMEPIRDGLGLIDYAIVPHFESDHPEAESADRAHRYMTENAIKHTTLRDGEVIVISADALSSR
jgi:dipeptidase E